jgi:hypothetical protein
MFFLVKILLIQPLKSQHFSLPNLKYQLIIQSLSCFVFNLPNRLLTQNFVSTTLSCLVTSPDGNVESLGLESIIRPESAYLVLNLVDEYFYSNTSLFYPIDINECPGACVPVLATCTNMPGSFSCQCIQGYQGDGETACNGKNVSLNHISVCVNEWNKVKTMRTLKLVFGGFNVTIT